MKYLFNVKASFGTLIEKSFNFILPAKILFSESQNLLEVKEFYDHTVEKLRSEPGSLSNDSRKKI